MMEDVQLDICRVCRSEAAPDKPLFYPCVCTGSIKYVHQECLVQWLKYSRKEYCELCKHRFSFTPIYDPDMPKRLPVKDIVWGLVQTIGRAVRSWLHYTLMAVAWLGIVPLTACRIYRCLFTGSIRSLLTLPLDMLSTENLVSDCFHGCFVVTCTLCAFISLVWLREQILHGGGPDWLDDHNQNNQQGMALPAEEGVAEPGLMPVPGAEPVARPEEEGGIIGEAGADENWNPIEWERAAEELTWERLLGLDGSLVFLEHVFWVVSLNTLFILVFAFCPYHIGNFILLGTRLDSLPLVTQCAGLVTTLLGYLVIATSLVLLHTLTAACNFYRIEDLVARSKRVFGLCYVVIKVSLLVVIEIGIFPLICGWWLDICSLSLLEASLKERETSFQMAPGTSMFIHWLVGMVYVFYFASFILMLREVLRPGVLWFLRNLNDPDFNPIQEMIHLPIYRHVRRFLASVVIFGTTVLVMLWLPIRVMRAAIPNFLPYNVMLSSEAPMSELSLELLLLQVVLPALLEQGHTRHWLKQVVRAWCRAAAALLDLRSYLLGDAENEGDVPPTDDPPPEDGAEDGDDDEEENDLDDDDDVVMDDVEEQAPLGGPLLMADAGLAAAHQAMLQGAAPVSAQPYEQPPLFAPKLCGLLLLMGFTMFLASLVALTAPVMLGRWMMALWMGETKVHELYTAGCGLYTCWLAMRCVAVLANWLPHGWGAICTRILDWALVAAKATVAAVLLLGVVPLLLGLLFELVVVVPLRVPLDQTPMYFPWQDWALGVLHTKIVCAVTMMGPNWWLKSVVEQVYNAGLRHMDLAFIVRRLCLPVICGLALVLALPYVIAVSIVPALGTDMLTSNLVLRRIYPSLLASVVLVLFCIFQTQQFQRLYEHIKNDKYLVGQRLVNYDRDRRPFIRTLPEKN